MRILRDYLSKEEKYFRNVSTSFFLFSQLSHINSICFPFTQMIFPRRHIYIMYNGALCWKIDLYVLVKQSVSFAKRN